MSESEKSEFIKNYLINRVKFTPRRLLFEEYNTKLRLAREEDYFLEKSPDIVLTKKYDLNALHRLGDFRSKYSIQCMSEFNLRKHQEKLRKDRKFLEHSCIHRLELNASPIKANETRESLCLKRTQSKNDTKETLLMKKDHKTEGESQIVEKTCQTFIENSFALMHQKMK